MVKTHKWFANFDFELLESGNMKAPIIPKIKNIEDLSNFEEYPEEEDIIIPYKDDGSNWDASF